MNKTIENKTQNRESQLNKSTHKPNPNKKRSKYTNNKRPQHQKNEQWYKNIQSTIEANKKIQAQRVYPMTYKVPNKNGAVKITPLGGLGEIGGNMLVIETNNSAVIVDVGMSFPDDEMHGVDILVPDFSYLRTIKNKIKGILITHAHEDHIGALPYLFKYHDLQFPIYATPLPLGMIANKFDEHKISKKFFRPVEKRKIYQIGDFDVEWIHITHSIIDASSLAITSQIGTIIDTGDFKIDHTPIDGLPTDLHRFAHYGDKGVLCLLSDSTNSYNTGFTKSESSVGPTFEKIFSQAKGRVIMSTFSSNIHRIYQAITHGVKHGRKVAVIGKSMEKNLNTAMELGYIKLDNKIFIDAYEVNKYNDNEVLIVTTGSQGEPMSALFRMATNEHRHIKIKPTDQIIISARAIPGNEASVSKVLNYLYKAGASVAYKDFSEIHVSGHAAQEEQKLMIRLVKPKFFLPVHGEYNHIHRHKETAMKCGIPEKNIYLMSDGEQIELTQKQMKKIGSVKTGKVFIDNQINKQIENNIVIDRQKLAEAGIISIIAQIDKSTNKLISKPRVLSYGIVPDKDMKVFQKDVENMLDSLLINSKKEVLENQKAVENSLRQAVRKHVFRKLKKYPTVIPTIFIL